MRWWRIREEGLTTEHKRTLNEEKAVAQTLEQLKDELLKPVSDATPCGEDLKYDERYEQLKAEISKLGGVGTGGANWQLISESGKALLLESKDLTLVSYVGLAWVHHEQAVGLVASLELLLGMVQQHWQGLHPQRAKSRKQALKWYQEKINQMVKACSSDDLELLERGQDVCQTLKTEIGDRYEDPPANFKYVRNLLEEWRIQAKPKQEVVVEPQAPAPAAPATASPAQPEQTPDQQQMPERVEVKIQPLAGDVSLTKVMEHLGELATTLYASEPGNPIACLLKRLSLWDQTSIPRNTNNQTNFPDPDANRVDALKNLRKSGEWQTLYDRAEDLFTQNWYWLDLQYYAQLAAESLGKQQLVETIERQTLALDTRLPGLKQCSYTNGTPFASTETKDWLAQLLLKAAGGGEGPDEVAALLSEMRKLSGDFAAAMTQAQQTIERAPDRRLAFRMQTEVARFCLEIGEVQWAESLVRALIDEMERYHLEHWEPKLAASVWRLVWEVTVAFEEDTTYRDWGKQAKVQLAKLDLTSAGQYPAKS